MKIGYSFLNIKPTYLFVSSFFKVITAIYLKAESNLLIFVIDNMEGYIQPNGDDQPAVEINEEIKIKPTLILEELGLPDLKQIETEVKPDADKIQREKEKVTQYMKEIKDKVNSYLSRADLSILSKDPEISNMQIEKPERQLYKIAQFVWSKIAKDNENEEKKSSEITYVEMIEQVQSILQQAINEGK